MGSRSDSSLLKCSSSLNWTRTSKPLLGPGPDWGQPPAGVSLTPNRPWKAGSLDHSPASSKPQAEALSPPLPMAPRIDVNRRRGLSQGLVLHHSWPGLAHTSAAMGRTALLEGDGAQAAQASRSQPEPDSEEAQAVASCRLGQAREAEPQALPKVMGAASMAAQPSLGSRGWLSMSPLQAFAWVVCILACIHAFLACRRA